MTKKPIGGQTKGTTTALFQKTLRISLVGNKENEINQVAHAIHSLNHPLTIGGRYKRKVTVSKLHSSDVIKIFDGKTLKIEDIINNT